MFIHIHIIIVSSLLINIEGRTFQHDESLFANTDLCSKFCSPDGEQHPICSAPARSDICHDDFFLYDLGSQNSQFQRDIMLGHNGIRNRIAERMKVANMVKLKWDTDLEAMATIWVSRCMPYKIDPCASFGPQAMSYDPEFKYIYINFNNAYIKSNFLPPNLIVSVLRNWYLEKNNMSKPHIVPYERAKIIKREYFGDMKVGYFDVNNNFTQLSNSDSERIGCALARYNKGYHFVCYYFPYVQYDSFISGEPGSQCPNLYPLSDPQFTNLCTGDLAINSHFENKKLNYYYFVFSVLFMAIKI